MMHALPNCTLVGLPTRGASGNPQPVHLGDGIVVYYSRWLSLMPDGSPIEGVGVQPDEEVKHERGSDQAYQRAVQILQQQKRS